MKGNNNTNFINKWESQVKKGILEFIILLYLKSKPYYGYELISDIKNLTSFEVAEGTIYPLLNRLKSEEFITSEWKEQEVGILRKYYNISENGKQMLNLMKDKWLNLSFAIQKQIMK